MEEAQERLESVVLLPDTPEKPAEVPEVPSVENPAFETAEEIKEAPYNFHAEQREILDTINSINDANSE